MRKTLPSGEQPMEREIELREKLIAHFEGHIDVLKELMEQVKEDIAKLKKGERL